MPRLGHGRVITEGDLIKAEKDLAEASARSPIAFAVVGRPDVHRFDFLFPALQEDEANLLPRTADKPAQLKSLGAAMVDADAVGEDSQIPAAYTYFGQFVDHDITLEAADSSATLDQLLDPAMGPLTLVQIRDAVRNLRTPTLDLDSVYDLPAPRDPANNDKMRLGKVTSLGGSAPPLLRPPGKTDDNDLPREPRSNDISTDRAALTGDPRNDENLIIGQLHVAFLKAHNKLVDQGMSFEQAQRTLRQHYQHIVVQDFLKRIAEPAVVDDIVDHGNRWFDPYADPSFMPLEFSVAAYRLGHTMVRAAYDFNLNFRTNTRPPASLAFLFTFTALSGQLGDNDTLPDNWIIQWENIIGDGAAVMKTRRIDTRLATANAALFKLQTVDGKDVTPPDAGRLAVRNLLRGYRLRLPTGQAVARYLGVEPMSKDDILAVAGAGQAAAVSGGGFESQTPLWYYVLAEAQHKNAGERLGTVGSTLVAEVLVGLVRRSADSILKQPGWQPSLPAAKPGTFELADLLRFAGVLPVTQQPPGGGQPGGGGQPHPNTYTVKSGDTLSGIAKAKLGNADRWTEIFLLNRAIIRDPDRIFPGQVLTLPPAKPTGPIPKLYVVKKGDTLFDIAKAKLGNGNRWPDIFKINRNVIANPDRIIPGMVLVLPNK